MAFKRYMHYALIYIIITVCFIWLLFPRQSVEIQTQGESVLYSLVSSDTATRQVGTEGHAQFEKILLQGMAIAGLRPVGDSFSHNFDMIGIAYDGTPSFSIHTDAETLHFTMQTDYQTAYNAYSGAINYTGDLLFLESNYYSASKALLKDKVVVTKFNQLTDDIIEYARENEVRGLLVFEDAPQNQALVFNPYFGQKEANDLYIAKINAATYAALKSIAVSNPLSEDTVGGVSGRIQGCNLKVSDRYPIMTGQNLIGRIDGKTHDRFVVFYSYYDSMGYYLGENYPNTLERLSGVAAMIDLIQYTSELSVKPECDIYFAFIDGGANGSEGVEQMLLALPDTGEYIEIGSLGIQNASSVSIASDAKEAEAGKLSTILASRIRQYFEATDIEPTNDATILNLNGSHALVGLNQPSVLITQITTETAMQRLINEDDIALFDQMEYEKGLTMLKAFVKKAYFGIRDVSYLPLVLRLGAFALWLLIGAVAFVSLVKDVAYSKLYHSVGFQIIKQTLLIVVPTVIMLATMVFILLIPSDITKADYGGHYTNYVLSLHIQRVYFYVTTLISGGGQLLTPSLQTALAVGFANTVKLFLWTIIIATTLGIAIGMWRGMKHNAVMDTLLLMLYAIPDVLMSLLGLYGIILLVKYGLTGPFSAEALRTTLMPIVVMSIVPTLYIIRIVQLKTEELLGEPFIDGARARGVGQYRLIFNHLLPMLTLHVCTSMASILRIIMVNLLVVEYLYASVGVGSYLIINRSDPTYVLIISALLGFLFLITNGLFKLLSMVLDPMRR